MKHLFIITLLALSTSLYAQDDAKQEETKTLISGKIESGGYGGVFVKFGNMYNETGVFVGGLGGWVINHRFVIGGKGYGLANEINIKDLNNIKLEFGCGGGYLEYMFSPNQLVNTSVHTMIGAGGVSYDVNNSSEPHSPIDYREDSFFVVEPGFNANLNITDHFRIGAGLTYRIVSGAEYGNIDDDDLSDLSAEVILKYGLF